MTVEMRKLRCLLTGLMLIMWLTVPIHTAAQTDDEAVVQAVLFYSPTCPHCHYVINEILIPLLNEQGDRLQLIGIDTTQPGGRQLYQAAIERYQLPDERQGVPTLVVGDIVLVGSQEIPEQFPTIVADALEADGLDWPDIPGLEQVLQAEARPTPAPTPQVTSPPALTPTPAPLPATDTPRPTLTAPPTPTANAVASLGDASESLSSATTNPPPDPLGFTLAGLVLVGMTIALNYSGLRVWSHRRAWRQQPAWGIRTLAIPLLALIGLGVSAYLAYVEITPVEAICGPVGECNVVQSSPYAQILGLPVAVLGLLNYATIIFLWTGQRYGAGRLTSLLLIGLVGLTLFGMLFSIYLTLLELFVIKAVCIWCLSSAVITTILMLLVVVPITTTSLSK